MSNVPKYDLTYLSLGAGVQSTALYVMTTLGLHDCPRADVAIFADTGDEPQYVYAYLERIEAWGRKNGGPEIARVSAGHLSADVVARCRGERKSAPAIPAFTADEAGRARGLMRHCTRDYKVRPLEREARRRIGPRRGARAACLLGISLDEASRMRDSRTGWIDLVYPLVEARLSREACRRIVVESGLPEPEKSACAFCPFHDDAYWRWLRAHHADDFDRAVEVDEAIRDMTTSGIMQPVYLHRSLRPLRDQPFDDGQQELFALECEGHCGV